MAFVLLLALILTPAKSVLRDSEVFAHRKASREKNTDHDGEEAKGEVLKEKSTGHDAEQAMGEVGGRPQEFVCCCKAEKCKKDAKPGHGEVAARDWGDRCCKRREGRCDRFSGYTGKASYNDCRTPGQGQVFTDYSVASGCQPWKECKRMLKKEGDHVYQMADAASDAAARQPFFGGTLPSFNAASNRALPSAKKCSRRASSSSCKSLTSFKSAMKEHYVDSDEVKDIVQCGEFLANWGTIGQNLRTSDYKNVVPDSVLHRVPDSQNWKPSQNLSDLAKPFNSTRKHPVLWCGFWEGDANTDRRSTLTALNNFARTIDGYRLHPDSTLGEMIGGTAVDGDLEGCPYEATGGIWSMASFLFAKRMVEGNTMLFMVNKDLDGDRSLDKSVMWQYELPAIAMHMKKDKKWKPKIFIVDLKGTCSKTKILIGAALFFGQWSDLVCIDCMQGSGCDLKEPLHEQLKELGLQEG